MQIPLTEYLAIDFAVKIKVGGNEKCREVEMLMSGFGLCTYTALIYGNQIRAENFILQSLQAHLFVNQMAEK